MKTFIGKGRKQWRRRGGEDNSGNEKEVLHGKASTPLKGVQPVDEPTPEQAHIRRTHAGAQNKSEKEGMEERYHYIQTPGPRATHASLKGLRVPCGSNKKGGRGAWSEVEPGNEGG